MNPIKRKMLSLLTEAAYKEIEALNPQSPLAKELNEIEDVDAIIVEEIKKVCNAATLAEMTKALLLIKRLNNAPLQEKEILKSELKSIAEKLMTKVKTETGPLKLAQCYRHILSGMFSST